MDDVADGEYRTRSFEEHFRPDARSDYSDLITKESPIPPRTETKKEEKPKKEMREPKKGRLG